MVTCCVLKDCINPKGSSPNTYTCTNMHTHTHTHTHTHIHHSHKITEMLEASPVWSAYKDQKHDLFISDTPVSGYLTGPTGVAGYLTAGTSTSAPLTAPPPPKGAP